jgi:hypothetical protein
MSDVPVHNITLEHVLCFDFYVPVQGITLEHVFCSDFVFPSKVLHWNMSYVLTLCSCPERYVGTYRMF